MKTEKLEIKVTPYQMAQVKKEAERMGTTKSDVIRGMIATLPKPD